MRFSLFTSLLMLSVSSFADNTNNIRAWSYTTAAGESNSVQVYDIAEQVGEESISWQVNGENRIVRVINVTDDSYDGEYVVENRKKETLMNYSLGLTTGVSYKKTLAFLRIESFRSAFEEIPSSCPDAANAFLSLTDNQDGKMYGYCLIPQN